MHLAGLTFDAIAREIGYSSRSGAYAAVQAALKARGDVPLPAEMLSTQLARVDAMLSGLWPAARRGDTQAVAAVLKLEERRTQIAGAAAAATGAERAREDPEQEGTTVAYLAARRAARAAVAAARKATTL